MISFPPGGEPNNLFRKFLFWFAAVLFLLEVLFAIFWPRTRAYFQAAAVLSQLNGQRAPVWLRPACSVPLKTETFTIASTVGPVVARSYIPERHVHAPGIVIIPGIHYLGIDEPRLTAFSRSIAACGIRVLTPELPGSRDYRIGPSDIAVIGDSVALLHRATGRPVGLIGLSFSGGLALMAAAQPPYSGQLSAVLSVGAHDDLYRVAMFYATGADPLPNGDIVRETPNNYGPWILEYEHLEDFTTPDDTEAVRSVLRARLYNDPALEEKAESQLSEPQKEEYARLLAHPSWPLALSNKKHTAEMAALSPHGHIAGLHVPVYILHGRSDNLIPFAESYWLAEDLPRGALKEQLVSPLIGHVSTDQGRGNLWNRFALVRMLARFLQQVEHP